jgi:hypothetical protein
VHTAAAYSDCFVLVHIAVAYIDCFLDLIFLGTGAKIDFLKNKTKHKSLQLQKKANTKDKKQNDFF